MFDKLKGMFEKTPEREFKPRQQGLRSSNNSNPVDQSYPEEKYSSADGTLDGKSVLIGHDPFNKNSEQSDSERIQSKMELLKQLQKELGRHG